ncbi:hypothetical protein CEW92_09220 [Bacillaceae bacterium SAS-127]|nr:hypothetical protein CEW92_09220 [Bacillaceae bacterium SAS-127]
MIIIASIVFFGLLWLISYWWNRSSIWNGLWFLVLAFFSAMGLAQLLFKQSEQVTLVVLAILIVVLVLLLPLHVLIASMLLFRSARKLWRREGRRFANYLSALLGLVLIGAVILPFVNNIEQLPDWLSLILSMLYVGLFYFLVGFMVLLVSNWTYRLIPPRKKQDYIIVLGSGLIDGYKVSPLLASRIEKGIEFQQKQFAKNGKRAKLIFSGGQGADELLPEGEAMQQYALSKGVREEDTLVERESVNTYENMLFSKKIMDECSPDGYSAIFVTNNYHVLRAGMWARKVGLRAIGLGSKTIGYFWINALIREYIGILVMHKWRHISVILFVFLMMLGLFWFSQHLDNNGIFSF